MKFEDLKAEARNFYEVARMLDPDDVLRMALEADNTEEKKFYTFVAMMNLEERYGQEFQEYISRKDDKNGEGRK